MSFDEGQKRVHDMADDESESKRAKKDQTSAEDEPDERLLPRRECFSCHTEESLFNPMRSKATWKFVYCDGCALVRQLFDNTHKFGLLTEADRSVVNSILESAHKACLHFFELAKDKIRARELAEDKIRARELAEMSAVGKE